MKIKNYYPGSKNPIHEVKDWLKVRDMMRTLKKGGSLPTIYCDGGNWLSGTHRVAASEILAKIKGHQPYDDLEIFDISCWTDRLSQDEQEAFCELWENDPEDACNLLDKSGDFSEFCELLKLKAYPGP